MLGMMVVVLVAAQFATTDATWEHLGPRNIFNDQTFHGEAGTLADAASPAGTVPR